MFPFITHLEKTNIFRNRILSVINFNSRQFFRGLCASLVGLYGFLLLYNFDTYGTHTGPVSEDFLRK